VPTPLPPNKVEIAAVFSRAPRSSHRPTPSIEAESLSRADTRACASVPSYISASGDIGELWAHSRAPDLRQAPRRRAPGRGGSSPWESGSPRRARAPTLAAAAAAAPLPPCPATPLPRYPAAPRSPRIGINGTLIEAAVLDADVPTQACRG
jgi:hypothetical protein